MLCVYAQDMYPSLVHSARGAGTFCAIDCHDSATRDKLVGQLKNSGTFYFIT